MGLWGTISRDDLFPKEGGNMYTKYIGALTILFFVTALSGCKGTKSSLDVRAEARIVQPPENPFGSGPFGPQQDRSYGNVQAVWKVESSN